MLRAAPNATAARLVSVGLEERFETPLAQWLGGRDARDWAALILAAFAGVAAMRDVVKVACFAPKRSGAMAALLGRCLQADVEPSKGRAAKGRRRFSASNGVDERRAGRAPSEVPRAR